jgi:hypothetical protein
VPWAIWRRVVDRAAARLDEHEHEHEWKPDPERPGVYFCAWCPSAYVGTPPGAGHRGDDESWEQ